VAGIAAPAIYAVLLSAPMPRVATASLAAAFGLLLIAASVGVYHFIAAHRVTLSLQLGVLLNIIAGALVTSMLFVQMAVRAGGDVVDAVGRVQLGLDAAWDAFIGCGTALIAANLARHPRFGRIFAWSGIAIGLALIAVNLATFPTPPREAGLVDLGPLVGLWYFAVSFQVGRSLHWLHDITSR